MIITVAFSVRNYVEVMESWPIKKEDMNFFLERDGNVLKKVCVSFLNVGIEHAPSLTPANNAGGKAHLSVKGGSYLESARKEILNWQAVVSGLQIVSLDYDNYEMRFRAERTEEESHIHLFSFKSNPDQSLNSACGFEQIGRAFCVGPISEDRIESTAHFRDGRIALEAERYVDSYNNMFLFLESRYCDGKTEANKQIELLSKQTQLCNSIDQEAKAFAKLGAVPNGRRFELFKPSDGIRDKIRTLVHLRGKLRHHSLKSPLRWDPNRQNEYESAARFLGAVVADIVIKESVNDIYSPSALEKFREISVSNGFETKVVFTTSRLENERALVLEMSFPTTVVSSHLCLNATRHAITACEDNSQLTDTVRFEATHGQSGLELVSLDFGVWAYSQTREIETKTPIKSIRCSFENFRSELIMRHEFSIPLRGQKLTILDVWKLLNRCFDHIEDRDPTTRIMSLKLFINEGKKAIVAYRVGAQVRN